MPKQEEMNHADSMLVGIRMAVTEAGWSATAARLDS
jgi:hypothetical protein